MTKTLRLVLALAAFLLVAVSSGCGSSTGTGGDPAALAPESSFLYAEATIDPQGSQEQAVRSILADLPGTGAPQDRLEDLMRKAIRSDKTTKVDWDKDIKPWLGDKVGGFVANPGAAGAQGGVPAALIVSTTDAGAARDALEKGKKADAAHRRYRDVEYIVESDDGDLTAYGVVDDYVVIGSDAGMRAAIDASKSKTLSENERYKQAIKDVPDERVGFMYMDLAGLVQLASQAAGDQVPGAALFGRLLGGKPVVITARAENQALIFEGGALPTAGLLQTSGDPRPLMESLPDDSWAALALPGFGDGIRAFVTGFAGALGGEQALADQLRATTGLDLQKDLLSWIGDVGVFVDGDTKSSLGGGLLVKSKDPVASKRALTKIAAAIAQSDRSTRVAAARVPGAFGYELKAADAPRGIYMVQAGDKVALTYGEDEAKAALSGGGLSGNAGFKRAADGLGGDYSPSLYVSAPPILRVAEAFGASGKDYDEAKPYLTILDYLIAGSDKSRARLRIGFKPHE